MLLGRLRSIVASCLVFSSEHMSQGDSLPKLQRGQPVSSSRLSVSSSEEHSINLSV